MDLISVEQIHINRTFKWYISTYIILHSIPFLSVR
uniref:Uncharacterized protein n=1 Tax=CrAss-like virus sp. ctRQZ5 TaxID=2826824 RepID=A0A8S5LXK2_9CAUD|nr:MAG TPA: hypothetical protein [CrAss-like virus sp. ctRQZ5]DAF01148.1 MAG TPA: hypothetical protein [Caudoviricetes sp.]